MDEHCITGLENVPASLRGCVLSIGNFDGVHLGHQEIFRVARQLAEPENAAVVAMTFELPPDLVLHSAHAPQRLLPHEQKCRLLRQVGADRVVTAISEPALLGMSPAQFIEQVILERFAPSHVVEGHNFFFGRERSGNLETLEDAGRTYGFDVHSVDPVQRNIESQVQRISSTLIRRLVQEGKVEIARQCLGRHFALFGRVVPGAGQGRKLSFPTVNLQTDPQQACPTDGVYAGWTKLDGTPHAAAISVGVKPTFDGRDRVIEAHLLDAEGNFYGADLVLAFAQCLRPQKRYKDRNQLKQQIERNMQRVREICQKDA